METVHARSETESKDEDKEKLLDYVRGNVGGNNV
jgi:hypothetical protein